MAFEPRPPSNRSVRSANSRARLAQLQKHEQVQGEILKAMQVTSQETGRHLVPSAFEHMAAVADEEASRVLAAGGVANAAVPDDLLARVDLVRRERRQPAKQPSPVASPTEDPTNTLPSVAAPPPAGEPGSEVRVDVAGKGMPLTTMIVDKVGQRGGQGGREATQLRKAFKMVDADKDGKITLAELKQLLSTIHISVSEQTLKRQFLRWTEGKPLLEWNSFIQQILPRDFPTEFNAHAGDVHDLASIARHDEKILNSRYAGLVTNLRDWQVAFRDKIMAKTRGGPLEIRKAWNRFDVDRSGEVTLDEILQTCASWNLFPTEEVKQQLLETYCTKENQGTGIVHFYDFVKTVIPQDFKSSSETLKQLKTSLEAKWGTVRGAFRAADTDGSGQVALEELKTMFRDLHIPASAQTAEAIFRSIDCDRSGLISMQEFALALQ